MGLAFHAEDVIHDVVVSMIADENCLAKFEHLTEPEAKAYFTACLTHRMIDIIRREKRHREYLETVECYEKKLKTESCSAETIVVEQLDFENNVAGTLRLLSTEERELLQQVLSSLRVHWAVSARYLSRRIVLLLKSFLSHFIMYRVFPQQKRGHRLAAMASQF